MSKAFNIKTNELKFDITNKLKAYIKLRGKKQIIVGASATGKSFLFNSLEHLISDNNTEYSNIDTSNIILINKKDNDGTLVSKLKRNSNKLIIIDRGDILIDKEAADVINLNKESNTYLIFARTALGINLSPNYYGELYTENDELKIKWKYSVRGWY